MTRQWREITAMDVSPVEWRDATYSVLDFETTGLNLNRDDIVAYGLVKIGGGRIQAGSALYGQVRPRRPVSVAALCVHGLRDADLATEPPLELVMDNLIAQLEGTILVAHAAWIERSFLDRAMKKQKTRVGPAVIDTAGLSRALGIAPFSPGREPSTEYLAGKLNLFAHTPHHALGDALTTAELFLALATRLEQIAKLDGMLSLTVADLVRYSAS